MIDRSQHSSTHVGATGRLRLIVAIVTCLAWALIATQARAVDSGLLGAVAGDGSAPAAQIAIGPITVGVQTDPAPVTPVAAGPTAPASAPSSRVAKPRTPAGRPNPVRPRIRAAGSTASPAPVGTGAGSLIPPTSTLGSLLHVATSLVQPVLGPASLLDPAAGSVLPGLSAEAGLTPLRLDPLPALLAAGPPGPPAATISRVSAAKPHRVGARPGAQATPRTPRPTAADTRTATTSRRAGVDEAGVPRHSMGRPGPRPHAPLADHTGNSALSPPAGGFTALAGLALLLLFTLPAAGRTRRLPLPGARRASAFVPAIERPG